VDPTSGGLVQPNPRNPSDPNAGLLFDWVEFAMDPTGFYGNTTCVDQFGLPITLGVTDRSGATAGPVGLPERRSDLFAAFLAETAAPFRSLVAADHLRIGTPGQATTGPLATFLDSYLRTLWDLHRTSPMVLTPDEGRFTGLVDKADRLVFTREGDPARYLIPARPTTAEAIRCDGPLASGNPLERVLGAQLAALINRHLLQDPLAWRRAALYYRTDPFNDYAAFWHRHGLGGKAYGFPYDDVNDQATLIHAGEPAEIRIGFRID